MTTLFDDEVAARTIYQEARGEGQSGMAAVAHVIRNRIVDGRWGKCAASVCLWRAQFSGWSSSDPNFQIACELDEGDGLLGQCAQIWGESGSDDDPTDGACFYFSTVIAPPAWANAMIFTVQIGKHRFYRDK